MAGGNGGRGAVNTLVAMGGRLQVTGLSYKYANRSDPAKGFSVLRNVSFEVAPGELLIMVGPSGCGKTTLLNLIAGFLRCQEGEVLIDGVVKQNPIGDCMLVSQELALFEWKTVLDNVAFGLKAKSLPKTLQRERALSFLELVNLAECAHKYPNQLSSGMRQRLALARALAVEPKVILLDEPFAALDQLSRAGLQDELLRISDKTGHTIVLVTHDVEEAVYLADRLMILTGRPARIAETLQISLQRPKGPRQRHSKEDLMFRQHVWNCLKEVKENIESQGPQESQ